MQLLQICWHLSQSEFCCLLSSDRVTPDSWLVLYVNEWIFSLVCASGLNDSNKLSTTDLNQSDVDFPAVLHHLQLQRSIVSCTHQPLPRCLPGGVLGDLNETDWRWDRHFAGRMKGKKGQWCLLANSQMVSGVCVFSDVGFAAHQGVLLLFFIVLLNSGRGSFLSLGETA